VNRLPAEVRYDWEGPRPRVSVVILTKNEEGNVVDCVASCAWCDDVHVLDSGSTDWTVDLATSAGATVHTNPFESFGKQRNWAIDHIPLKHDWVFHLDADERFTGDLVREMERLLDSGPAEAGYYVPNMLIFSDHWLKRTGNYPAYQMRLFHKQRMRFRDYGHGQREDTTGPIGTLRNPYLHFNFSKGLEDWFDKHNKYSTLEAKQAIEERSIPMREIVRGMLSFDRVTRRRSFKRLLYRVPGRPLLFYLFTVLPRLGILDGPAGMTYARMRAVYDGMTELKVAVLDHERKTGLTATGSPRVEGARAQAPGQVEKVGAEVQS
jgi:glycosyltransferase involved in cell wall biosynthesis